LLTFTEDSEKMWRFYECFTKFCKLGSNVGVTIGSYTGLGYCSGHGHWKNDEASTSCSI